jgi:hypothetical protein
MNARRITFSNQTVYIIIAVAVVIVAFFLFGGGPWLKGLSHGTSSKGLAHWNWVQISISLGIGFLIGVLVGRRKW